MAKNTADPQSKKIKPAGAPLLEKLAQWLADYRLPLAAVLLAVSVVLGYIGFVKYFAATGEPGSLWDIAYYTLRLLNPAATPLQGSLNTELQIARFLSALALLYIATEALISIFRDQVQLIRLRSMKNHIIICGLGQKGLLLADSYRQLKERVVVIESDENNAMIGHCMDRGAVVLTGNAADSQLLRKARAHKARCVISVCGNDSTNAEVALNLRQLVSRRKGMALSCLVHIVDLQLWSVLREREMRLGKVDILRMSFFNIYESGARALLYEHPFFAMGEGREAAGPHILVVGMGRMGESLILNAARMWRYSDSFNAGRLNIYVVDKEAGRKKESLLLRYPHLTEICELHSLEIDVTSPEFERGTFLFNENRGLDFKIIYICLGNEPTALAAALRLYQRLKPIKFPMIVRMNLGSGLAGLLWSIDDGQQGQRFVHVFPLLERTCTPELIWGGSTFEVLARAIHEDYVAKALKRGETTRTNRSIAPWDDLPETLKESNRNQAENISGKLQRFGYDFVMTSDWNPKPVAFSSDEVEEMSKIEHKRFVDERLRQGWKYGAVKNEEKKISPTLIPWDELSEEEKDKDRNTVIGIPQFLAEAGYQVYRLKQEE